MSESEKSSSMLVKSTRPLTVRAAWSGGGGCSSRSRDERSSGRRRRDRQSGGGLGRRLVGGTSSRTMIVITIAITASLKAFEPDPRHRSMMRGGARRHRRRVRSRPWRSESGAGPAASASSPPMSTSWAGSWRRRAAALDRPREPRSRPGRGRRVEGLGLHPLSVEDISERKRAGQVELVGDVIHIVAFVLERKTEVTAHEVDFVLGPDFLLSVHPAGWDPMAVTSSGRLGAVLEQGRITPVGPRRRDRRRLLPVFDTSRTRSTRSRTGSSGRPDRENIQQVFRLDGS